VSSTKQRAAAPKNLRKAEAGWRARSRRNHSRGPERSRAKSGPTGTGGYYHVEVRPETQFATFRTQDVGERGGIERVAGRRAGGAWDTLKWLIGKAHAHVERGRLVPDSPDARKVLDPLGSSPRQIGGDRFEAVLRPGSAGAARSTAAQKRARPRNK